MIAWNEEQEEGLESETFRRLLVKLGFEVYSRNSQFPIRIPANDWPIYHLLYLAERFGPIPEDEKPSAFTYVYPTFDHVLILKGFQFPYQILGFRK